MTGLAFVIVEGLPKLMLKLVFLNPKTRGERFEMQPHYFFENIKVALNFLKTMYGSTNLN